MPKEKNIKKRIMSGMRPTGKLHIGHYLGVLENWKSLQDEYDCFFSVADWHALTTKYNQTTELKQNILDVVLDWLACGIDHEKSTIYLQSLVPETAELHIYLSMITPQNWIERNPTIKDMQQILPEGDISYGLLGYPVLQSADILGFNASLVPIGKDQLPHLEFSRDIARRFNHIYKTDYFNEPKPKLAEVPVIKGLDGQKMGKSFNNDIKISDSEDETAKKIKKAITDRSRIQKTDPGHPELCEVVFDYYKIFADEKMLSEVDTKCRNATHGCADCKKQLTELINESFRDIRAKRNELQNNLDYVKNIIEQGSGKARENASIVLKDVKNIMNLY